VGWGEKLERSFRRILHQWNRNRSTIARCPGCPFANLKHVNFQFISTLLDYSDTGIDMSTTMNDPEKEPGAQRDDVYSQANPPREGFTKADQKHMYRLGKVQELKVRADRKTNHQSGSPLTNTAKLPPSICPELRGSVDGNMGVFHACQYSGAYRWRTRRSLLELYLDICRVQLCGTELG
jgi:hypothetical protein